MKKGGRFTRQEEIRTENTATGHSKEMSPSPANLELGLGSAGLQASRQVAVGSAGSALSG